MGGSGVDISGPPPRLCTEDAMANSIPPGRQQFITNTAIHAFFESIFADEQTHRTEAIQVWQQAIQKDYPEVRVRLGGAY